MSKRHKHYFRLGSIIRGGQICAAYKISEACECGIRRIRVAGKDEQKLIEDRYNYDSDKIHAVCDDFTSCSCVDENDFEREWKLLGPELIATSQEFASSHPQHVRIVKCEDRRGNDALILSIENSTDDKWHGLRMFFISQSGQIPTELFLYPESVVQLLRSLYMLKAKPVSRKSKTYASFADMAHDREKAWKLRGYDLVEEAEKFAKNRKKNTRAIRCDDSNYASSTILCISRAKNNSRVAMFFAPQFGNPAEAHLSLEQIKELMNALKYFNSRCKPILARERKREIEYAKKMRKAGKQFRRKLVGNEQRVAVNHS